MSEINTARELIKALESVLDANDVDDVDVRVQVHYQRNVRSIKRVENELSPIVFADGREDEKRLIIQTY